MIYLLFMETEATVLKVLPDIALCISSLAVTFIIPPVNISVSLSSLSHSSKIIETEEEAMGISDL